MTLPSHGSTLRYLFGYLQGEDDGWKACMLGEGARMEEELDPQSFGYRSSKSQSQGSLAQSQGLSVFS